MLKSRRRRFWSRQVGAQQFGGCLALVAAISCAGEAFAQQITVQQPQVTVFSVDTAVSVPDRGSVLLGNVSGASSGTRVYGPSPWGTSLGRSSTGLSVWSSVWIHDFEAMDKALLNIPRVPAGGVPFEGRVPQLLPDRPGLNPPTNRAVIEQAARARQQMLMKSQGR